MKKLFLLALGAIMAVGASAQSGNWYAGGQLTFGRTTESVGGSKATQVTVLPEIGYNITDNLAVGSVLGVSYRKAGDEKKTVFKINPYLRYTYYSYDRVNLFADLGVDMGIGRANGSTAVEYGIGIRPGVSFDINDKFSLVAHLGFLGYQGGNRPAKRNGAPENWGFDFNSNNIMFGFYYNF